MKWLARLSVASALVLCASLPDSADAAFWGYDSAPMPCEDDRVATPCPGALSEPNGMMGAFSGMMGRWFGTGTQNPTTTAATTADKTTESAEQTATTYQTL